MSKQIFGSSLNRPWALVKWGGNQPNGRRPSTAVVYCTDPIKDGDVITGYEGGIVEFYRKAGYHTGARDARVFVPGEPYARWHFRYQRPRTFALADICEFFPCGKSRDAGPPQSMVRAAKKRVPPNPDEDSARCPSEGHATAQASGLRGATDPGASPTVMNEGTGRRDAHIHNFEP